MTKELYWLGMKRPEAVFRRGKEAKINRECWRCIPIINQSFKMKLSNRPKEWLNLLQGDFKNEPTYPLVP